MDLLSTLNYVTLETQLDFRSYTETLYVLYYININLRVAAKKHTYLTHLIVIRSFILCTV